jgi:hypothetical protein
MDFVDDIDFEFSTGWGVGNAFPKFFDAFNAPVGGTVDLKDIEAPALLNFLTNIVIWIEIGFRSFGAVESFGEDAGGGGFSYPAGPDKKKRMCKTSLRNGVREGTDNVFLADELGKGARPIFASENEVAHDSLE